MSASEEKEMMELQAQVEENGLEGKAARLQQRILSKPFKHFGTDSMIAPRDGSLRKL